MPISINVSGSSFDRGSSVIGSIHESGGMAEQSDAVLVELREIRERLSEADDLSRAISSLEEAIRDQDKPKISKITKQLSANFSSSLLANLASGGLMAFLGIN